MLLKIYCHCVSFLKRKDGASGIEYAIIAAMVAVVLAGFVTDISTQVSEIMEKIKDGITPPTTP